MSDRIYGYDLLRRGGAWLGAARKWLQHKRTTKGISGDMIRWGDPNARFELGADSIEELAAEVAAAALNERDDESARSSSSAAPVWRTCVCGYWHNEAACANCGVAPPPPREPTPAPCGECGGINQHHEQCRSWKIYLPPAAPDAERAAMERVIEEARTLSFCVDGAAWQPLCRAIAALDAIRATGHATPDASETVKK